MRQDDVQAEIRLPGISELHGFPPEMKYDTVYLDLPTGDDHGWGVVGDSLASALAAITPVQRIRPEARPDGALAGTLLQSIGANLHPHHPELVGTRRVGYAVFENDVMARRVGARRLGAFDAIATACRWGEDALRGGGLTSVSTVPHGVDGVLFCPTRASRRSPHDRFIIFSGGKFEFRKAQDVVVQAFKIFAQRHTDVFPVAAWDNSVPASAATMADSPYWPFMPERGMSFTNALKHWLAVTGVDLERVKLLPYLPKAELAAVYGDSDVGLFPNRCEGATNLVLMEYLACGRTAVATNFSGHRDILSDANSMPLRASGLSLIRAQGKLLACWCEPDVDEILERLEQGYRDRDMLARLGRQASRDMAEWTWERAAGRLLGLL